MSNQEQFLNSPFFPSPFERQGLKESSFVLFVTTTRLKISLYSRLCWYFVGVQFNQILSNLAFTTFLAWYQHLNSFSVSPLSIFVKEHQAVREMSEVIPAADVSTASHSQNDKHSSLDVGVLSSTISAAVSQALQDALCENVGITSDVDYFISGFLCGEGVRSNLKNFGNELTNNWTTSQTISKTHLPTIK